jgi:hypothetical protein
MGMAANPSGAHQAGRVFAGRIDGLCVSVRDRRTLTPASWFTEIQTMSAGAYQRHLGFWVPFPSILNVRTSSYVSNKGGTEANDALST